MHPLDSDKSDAGFVLFFNFLNFLAFFYSLCALQLFLLVFHLYNHDIEVSWALKWTTLRIRYFIPVEKNSDITLELLSMHPCDQSFVDDVIVVALALISGGDCIFSSFSFFLFSSSLGDSITISGLFSLSTTI